MKFNIRLKQLRQARRLTQVELAKRLGISSAAVSMYESGQREPNFETEELIADFFNVDIDYLRGKRDTTTEIVTTDTHLLFKIYKRLDSRSREMVTAYAQGVFDTMQENRLLIPQDDQEQEEAPELEALENLEQDPVEEPEELQKAQ
jgi:transcriptional regulator with XRE-family HTH domain